jgi:hypothetical protein
MVTIGSTHYVKDHWTEQGIYTGSVKQVGRAKGDFVLEGQGRCVLTYPSKVVVYNGNWQNDKKHGYGVLKVESKDIVP